MKRALLSIVFLMGCAAGATLRDLVVPARAANTPALAYEYKVISLGTNADEATEVFDRFGKEGWRVVTAQVAGFATLERQLR